MCANDRSPLPARVRKFLLNHRKLLGLALLLMLAQAACAQPPTVQLQELTWTELRARIDAGSTTVIIPIGGTEQSGPYIALGKHNARAAALAERIARALGNALVAPVVAYVPEGSITPPSGHMRFPGTISVPDAAFEQMLASAAESLAAHGFRHVVLLGDHGGYQHDLRRVVERLNTHWAGSPKRAFAPPAYYAASSTGYAALLRRHGYRDDEIGTHAALADTSLQLAVAPSMVRADTLRHASAPGAADGVYGGDPRRASAALGQLGVDLIVTQTVAAIRKDLAGH
ncbi:MAG: creatininase family protein [Rhodanobacter sp.]|nr:creatininase family protein [Rhodanobacter sp.]